MKIKDFIRKLEDINVYPNYEKIRQRYNAYFKEETWLDFDVTFYILFIDEPLWKFYELYDKWYEAETKNNETEKSSLYIHEDTETISDFMIDNPTDEQIEDYINGKEITFESRLSRFLNKCD